jgi:hypothetical protein
MPKKKPLEVEVKRETWLTGEYIVALGGSSQLLNGEGFMCCFGFVCRAAGIPASAIAGQSTPLDVADSQGHERKLTGVGLLKHDFRHTDEASKAMDINDRKAIERKPRERAIKRLLSKIGISVHFTGRYPNYKKLKERNV